VPAPLPDSLSEGEAFKLGKSEGGGRGTKEGVGGAKKKGGVVPHLNPS
jgi:hypothetical protein